MHNQFLRFAFLQRTCVLRASAQALLLFQIESCTYSLICEHRLACRRFSFLLAYNISCGSWWCHTWWHVACSPSWANLFNIFPFHNASVPKFRSKKQDKAILPIVDCFQIMFERSEISEMCWKQKPEHRPGFSIWFKKLNQLKTGWSTIQNFDGSIWYVCLF